MKRIDRRGWPGGRLGVFALGMFTLMVGILTGCDASLAPASQEPDKDATQRLAEMALVEAVEMTIVNPGAAKEEQYFLHVALDTDSPVRLPEAFHVLGMRSDGAVARMEDHGLHGDQWAGDGIYSAQVDRACLEDLDTSAWLGKDIISLTLTCEIDFISPGAECEGEGVCPESASRSFLWGLIEYEVDVVTCWCFQGCDVDVEFSLGKDDPAPRSPLFEPI